MPYTRTPPTTTYLVAAAVVRKYREHCCKATCEFNYLLYLEHDGMEAPANVEGLGMGPGRMSLRASTPS